MLTLRFRATPRALVLPTCALLLLGMIARPKAAWADATAQDRATARALAGEGYAALKSKDYATAEDRFRRADELVHAPTLVLDYARALVGSGHFGEAYAAYQRVTSEQLPPDAPAVWKRAVKDAKVEIETVAPKVAWLTIRVKGASDAQVEIDRHPLATEHLGERLPQTAGERQIDVSAPGFVGQTIEKQLEEGDDAQVEITLQPVPKPAPVIVVVPRPEPSRATVVVEDRRKSRRTLAYVSYGVSGLGIAVGAATGILWLKARSDIKSACGSLACRPQTGAEQDRLDDDKRRYDTFGTLSGIGFGVGLIGAVTGTALLLSQPGEEPKAESQAEPKHAGIEPLIGPSWLGVRGAFQ